MGQKILVVEDNELNLKLFCDLLRAHGYETEPVRDGRDAVARARAFEPDLVVMDIQMPYVSGLELIEQMKNDDGLRRTPIMAVTAYAAKGDEERIRDAGAEGYVSKPISVVKFVEAVAGLLAAAAARAPEPSSGDAIPDSTTPSGKAEPVGSEANPTAAESGSIEASPAEMPVNEAPAPDEAEREEDADQGEAAEALPLDPPVKAEPGGGDSGAESRLAPPGYEPPPESVGEAEGNGRKSAAKRRKRGKSETGPSLI